MSYDYSENILVQESSGNLLRNELGWDVKFAYNTEVPGENGTFGRKSYKEILLTRYFREALKKLNSWITDAQIAEAQDTIEKHLSTASLMQINEEKYFLIRDGIPVTVKKQGGRTETKKTIVIDFLNPENNYFLAVKELKIHGDLYRRRTDIVGFVNGIPLLFVELKKNTVDIQNAYDDNYTDYKDTVPHLFYQTGANAVCGIIEDKKAFSTYASELIRLKKYLDRSDVSEQIRREYDAITAIYGELQKKRRHTDITGLMVEINGIINEYVKMEEPDDGIAASRQFDISEIDFFKLSHEFARVKNKNLIFRDLQEIIQQKLECMMFNNPQRINYYERYQKIISDYNAEMDQAMVEKTFMDLLLLANNIDQEEKRYIREGFSSDEELSLYDMLFKEDLTKKDIKRLKEVSVSLLKKIKAKIAELDHWTDKQETKAAVDNLIRDTLWTELPESYTELQISGYRRRIYEYVYMRYKNAA